MIVRQGMSKIPWDPPPCLSHHRCHRTQQDHPGDCHRCWLHWPGHCCALPLHQYQRRTLLDHSSRQPSRTFVPTFFRKYAVFIPGRCNPHLLLERKDPPYRHHDSPRPEEVVLKETKFESKKYLRWMNAHARVRLSIQ